MGRKVDYMYVNKHINNKYSPPELHKKLIYTRLGCLLTTSSLLSPLKDRTLQSHTEIIPTTCSLTLVTGGAENLNWELLKEGQVLYHPGMPLSWFNLHKIASKKRFMGVRWLFLT